MGTTTTEDRGRETRLREMLADELEGARLYARLADLADTEAQAEALRGLATSERCHARHWAELLADLSLLEKPGRLSWRNRILLLFARFGGLGLVLERLRAAELQEIRRYAVIRTPRGLSMRNASTARRWRCWADSTTRAAGSRRGAVSRGRTSRPPFGRGCSASTTVWCPISA